MSEQVERLTAALAGRYAIERELGSGGMATVYLAEDLKHKRQVAVKVLRPELAAILGAERFLQEIEVTANLQHPNILPLHDSGEADGLLYYVMPFVEGESLRHKLEREKQLGVQETIDIAKGVSAALEYAHEQNVIHRDIKPENILLQRGQPVVADFGIALAVSELGGTRLTETGLSLGTPQYMSPEQAMGDRVLDARSDIYSLGCVVYEMLTGEPPHTGTDARAVIAKILSEPPSPIHHVRDAVPPNVEAAVRCALAKVPADRFANASAFEKALSDPGFSFAPSGQVALNGPIEPARLIPRTMFIAGSAIMVGLSVALGWGLRARTAPLGPVARLEISPEPRPSGGIGSLLALSPDGETVVYSSDRLYIRRLQDLESQPIAGTEGGYLPFFSPDGEWIGFVSGADLLKVRLDGTPPVAIARDVAVGDVRGASWGSNNDIVFAPSATADLMKVSGDGGDVTPVHTTSRSDWASLRWPHVLPDGRAVLVTIWTNNLEDPVVGVVSLETGEVSRLLPGTFPTYSSTGHVVFARGEGTLLAAPFDARQHVVTGPAVAIERDLAVYFGGAAQYTISASGTLAYRMFDLPERALILVDENGTGAPLSPDVRAFRGPPRISPDGGLVTLGIGDRNDVDVWVYDIGESSFSRVTDTGAGQLPSWTPDGSRVIFNSNRAGSTDIYARRWNRGGPVERVVGADDVEQERAAWAADGLTLFVQEIRQGTLRDISVVTVGRDTVPRPFLSSRHREMTPSPSPTSRWIAYVSDESGRNEVYVQSYPDTLGRRTVSIDGGANPVWGSGGRRIFYQNGDSLMAASVDANSDFRVLDRTLLFEREFVRNGFDVHPDGEHFVMLETLRERRERSVFVLNWLERLREMMKTATGSD